MTEYKIIEQFLTPNPYSRTQMKLRGIWGIVIHWTGNPNTSAKANRNFFESRKGGTKSYGSAHEIIDLDGDVIICLPKDEVAYHVGSSLPHKPGSKQIYTPEAWDRLNTNRSKSIKPYPNNCTYGIECTHINWNGNMTEETYETLVNRCVDLCIEFDLDPLHDLWLHQEVVGWKDCHRFFVNNKNEWFKFKQLVNQRVQSKMLGVVDMILKQWQIDMGKQAIDNLNKKTDSNGQQMVSDSEEWKKKLEESPSKIVEEFPWLIWVLLDRATNK